MRNWIGILLVICGLNLLNASSANAQGKERVITISGLVVSGDSAYGIMGVHVYIPNASVGTITNQAGLFRISAIPGDTIIFSHIAYEKQKLVVPEEDYQISMSVLIDMETENTLLPVIEVFPYPTEEIFKEAFLALDLSDKRENNMRKNLNSERIALMANQTGMSAYSNHRWFMDQQVNQLHNRYFNPTLSLTNPFAWARFIKSVKNGDLKKK